MKETTTNALSLKEQWDSYQVRIEELEDLRDEMYEALRNIHRNIDHNPYLDHYVEEWLSQSPKNKLYPILEREDFEILEGVAFVTDCVIEHMERTNQLYPESYEDEGWDDEREREWYFETLFYNVSEMTYSESLPLLDEQIEKLKDEQFDLIRSKYLAAYENACDDLYYGYGYKTWAEGTAYVEGHRQLFDSEEDAKFVWHLAFEKMANDED